MTDAEFLKASEKFDKIAEGKEQNRNVTSHTSHDEDTYRLGTYISASIHGSSA